MSWCGAASRPWWPDRSFTISLPSGESSGARISSGSASGRRAGSGRWREPGTSASEPPMPAPEAAADFRFDWPEFAERARSRLHREVPQEGHDLTLKAARGDDDLNPGATLVEEVARGTRAAVLVPIVKREPQASILLTQRTMALSSHAGQVAFPGGKFDRDDRDAAACALREAFEETGLSPDFVNPVGYLDPYQTRTGFRVIPVVALIDTGFELKPAPDEVDAVFEVPLAFLMDPRHHRRETRMWRGRERHFCAMPCVERYILGATAGMIRNLYERLYAMS